MFIIEMHLNNELISVHIVAQRANRYIVAFHIAISYDICLSGGSSQAMQTVGVLVLYWRPAVMCSLRMSPIADADPQDF